MADALRILARLRRLELTLARRDLAVALGGEIQAEQALRAAREAPRDEARGMAHPESASLPADFAAWLPAAHAAIARRAERLGEMSRARVQASEQAAQAHAAQEAVQALRETRARQASRLAMRRAQLELDELGRRERR